MLRLVRPVLAVACFAGLAVGVAAAEAPPVKLEKGDRIVFLGDSITAAAVGPKGFVTLIKKDMAEKHKDLDVKVIGAGVSGNRVPDIQKRLEKDVLSKKPTIVVIYIGINDVWHFDMKPPRGTSKKDYAAGLRDVIKRCQTAGARVILCTPSVIGEKKPGSNRDDAKLDAYAEISRTVAKEMKVPVCDLHKDFQVYETKHNPENKDRGILTRDSVHLTDAGNQFVADAILKALGASSAPAWSASEDGAKAPRWRFYPAFTASISARIVCIGSIISSTSSLNRSPISRSVNRPLKCG